MKYVLNAVEFRLLNALKSVDMSVTSDYKSELTGFLGQLKQHNPALEESQRLGRARLWDKEPIDLEARKRAQQARVKQAPYVYYQNF